MDKLSRMTSLSVWLAFCMTTFLVTSRAALLWLLRLYKYEQIHPVTWYLVVFLLLEVPHISNLIYILWNTPIISAANREPLPRATHVAIGILASLLEGVATAMFATEVAHLLPEPVLLTLPYATLTFVILRDGLKSVKHDYQHQPANSCLSSVWRCVRQSVHVLLFSYTFWVASAVGVVLCVWSQFSLSVAACIVLSTCFLLLSSIWSPAVHKITILSSRTGRRCSTVDLLYIPIKIMSVMAGLLLSLFFKLEQFRIYTSAYILFAFSELSQVGVWLAVVCCCIGGFLSFMNVVAASKTCLIKPGMMIPLFLCPAMTVLTTAVLWNDFETAAFWEVFGNDMFSLIAIGLSAVTWLIPFILPSFRGFRNPVETGRDLRDSFYSFTWNPFFLEPRMIMNHEARSIDAKQNSERAKIDLNSPRRKTVFICTTMYKESETEMKRYLKSIKNVFMNNDNNKLNIEAHVFFDSSITDDEINPRGRHLISLMCDMFQVDLSYLDKLATPYGCQVHTGSLLNYPLYIHFKDSAKVKAKKRWSQVMYMHYVLQFRCGNLKTDGKDGQYGDALSGKKLYKESKFSLENDFDVRNPYMKYLSRANEKLNLNYFNTSIPAVSDSDDSIVRNPTVTKDYIGGHQGLQNLTCCCSSHNMTSVLNKQNTSGDHEGPCTCKETSCYTLPVNDPRHLKSADEALPRHLSSRRSSFSTVASDKDYSSSSGFYSTRTFFSWESQTGKAASSAAPVQDFKTTLEDVYLLTTDADTEFTAKSVQHVLEQCEADPRLGAVCGRTRPVGTAKPIVWYQKFEYAKDFWLVKSSQNVIGSVTCCPGCFSIYRGAAIAGTAEEFSQPPGSAFDSLVMDHGEDRWLCTLLMQSGWRLAYSSESHNSTHCPETVGEFLRQRRRWVLSELSNMAAIFMSVTSLVRNNSSFSGMFLISLFTTFLWVILSPSTTLVFLCAGMDILYSVPLPITLPIAMALFIGYCAVCCLANQSKQKLVSLAMTFAMASIVVVLGVGFIIYVVQAVQLDLVVWGSVQFRPYFLVFLLIISIVYAALLHPKESLSLVYGFAYALLFPAMFVVLPGYALANMLDQSWGTRESGSHGCCQEPVQEEDKDAFRDYRTVISGLPTLDGQEGGGDKEHAFWERLQAQYIGNEVNAGMSAVVLSSDLQRLRLCAVSIFVAVNLFWFSCLSVLYAFAGSDVICYCVAAIFSFSLLVQLIGLTCYKCNTFLEHYLQKNLQK